MVDSELDVVRVVDQTLAVIVGDPVLVLVVRLELLRNVALDVVTIAVKFVVKVCLMDSAMLRWKVSFFVVDGISFVFSFGLVVVGSSNN